MPPISTSGAKLFSYFSAAIAFKRKNILFSAPGPRAALERSMSVTSETAPLVSERDTRPWLTEDWLSLAIGLFIFAGALGALGGVDLLGWAVSTSVWIDPAQALTTVSKAYAALGG